MSRRIGASGLTIAVWVRPESYLGGMADNRIVSKALGDGEHDHDWMLSGIRDGGAIRPRFRFRAGGQTRTLIGHGGRFSAGQPLAACRLADGVA